MSKADSHARGHRPRCTRRRRRRQERVRSQLPDPPGLRRGVDPRWREADRVDQGCPRRARARHDRRGTGPQGAPRGEPGQAHRQGRRGRSPVRLGQDLGRRGRGRRGRPRHRSTSARSRSSPPIKSTGDARGDRSPARRRSWRRSPFRWSRASRARIAPNVDGGSHFWGPPSLICGVERGTLVHRIWRERPKPSTATLNMFLHTAV